MVEKIIIIAICVLLPFFTCYPFVVASKRGEERWEEIRRQELAGKELFYITHLIDGRYVSKVYASSAEEAKSLAEKEFADAQFGDLDVVDEAPLYVTNEKGDVVWHRN